MQQIDGETEQKKQFEVLVVEDNATDRFWLEYTLHSLGMDCSLSVAEDGEKAVDFLLKRGDYSGAPTPDVIFLDVHLPKLDAVEVLRQIPNAQDLPICVLSGSESERELFQDEFGIQDSDYLHKPVSYESLVESDCCRKHLGPVDRRK